jgi:hypothetical protein
MSTEEIKHQIELNVEEIKALENMPPVTDRMFADIIKLREKRLFNLRKHNRTLTAQLNQGGK